MKSAYPLQEDKKKGNMGGVQGRHLRVPQERKSGGKGISSTGRGNIERQMSLMTARGAKREGAEFTDRGGLLVG